MQRQSLMMMANCVGSKYDVGVEELSLGGDKQLWKAAEGEL
jgi:hypothetical protein